MSALLTLRILGRFCPIIGIARMVPELNRIAELDISRNEVFCLTFPTGCANSISQCKKTSIQVEFARQGLSSQ